jgi:hypothetical protein
MWHYFLLLPKLPCNSTVLEEPWTPQCFVTRKALSRRPLTAEAWVHARISPYGPFSGQNGAGTGFSSSSSVFICHCDFTVDPHILIYHLGDAETARWWP